MADHESIGPVMLPAQRQDRILAEIERAGVILKFVAPYHRLQGKSPRQNLFHVLCIFGERFEELHTVRVPAGF